MIYIYIYIYRFGNINPIPFESLTHKDAQVPNPHQAELGDVARELVS